MPQNYEAFLVKYYFTNQLQNIVFKRKFATPIHIV